MSKSQVSGRKRNRELYERESYESSVKGKFVLSVPMYVPEDMSGYSSDETDDGTFAGKFDFKPSDPKTLPYKTLKDTKESEGIVFIETDEHSGESISSRFLGKLETQAFEFEADRYPLKDISVCIGLNRKYSLSTRSNNSLKTELGAALTVKSPIKHDVMAFFWNVQWYDKEGKETSYHTVKKFYKQLKQKNPELAAEFLRINEGQVSPPYQELREVLRLHKHTESQVALHREASPASPIYFVMMDSDVYDFNHVFSAYQRILASSRMESLPVVMSTGYLFSEKEVGWPFLYASRADMAIRQITAKHFGPGAYYPEPNTAIIIPDKEPILPESFIDSKRGEGALESPVVLGRVLQRAKEVDFIFSEDNSLITRMPERCKYNKSTHKPLIFSDVFNGGGEPTTNDILQLRNISQSHLNERTWAESLYYNRGFTLKGNFRVFTGTVCNLLGAYEENIDVDISSYEARLREFGLTAEIIRKISGAAKKIALYKKSSLLNLPNFSQLFEFVRQDFRLPTEVNYLEVATKQIIIELYERHFEFTAKLLRKKSITDIVTFYSNCSEAKFHAIEEVLLTIETKYFSLKFLNSLYDGMSAQEVEEGIFVNYVSYLEPAIDDFEDYFYDRDLIKIRDRIIEISNITKEHKKAFIEAYKNNYTNLIELKDNNIELIDILTLIEKGVDLEEALELIENGKNIEEIIAQYEASLNITREERGGIGSVTAGTSVEDGESDVAINMANSIPPITTDVLGGNAHNLESDL